MSNPTDTPAGSNVPPWLAPKAPDEEKGDQAQATAPPAEAGALGADEREQFEAFKRAEAQRQADLEAERQAISDAELAEFRRYKAEADAKEAAAEEARRQAAAERQAEEDEARRRVLEDRALCPNCQAPRNNPSRKGHPEQEYLQHCWACGWGSVRATDRNGEPLQQYPVIDEAAA